MTKLSGRSETGRKGLEFARRWGVRERGEIVGSLYVFGKLPTYPSPSQHFALSEKVVNVDLGKG